MEPLLKSNLKIQSEKNKFYKNQIGKAPAFKFGDEPFLLLQTKEFFGKIYIRTYV
jgi:hypothetical protein